MAVGRRTWLGGLLRPLSPTEGKFRVKGNYFLAAAGGAISVAVRIWIDQWRRFSGVCDTFQEEGGFFRLAE
jgi:hypothetical protein